MNAVRNQRNLPMSIVFLASLIEQGVQQKLSGTRIQLTRRFQDLGQVKLFLLHVVAVAQGLC